MTFAILRIDSKVFIPIHLLVILSAYLWILLAELIEAGWRQAIIWTNAGILLIGPLGTKFSGTLIGIQTFSLNKRHLKMSA